VPEDDDGDTTSGNVWREVQTPAAVRRFGGLASSPVPAGDELSAFSPSAQTNSRSRSTSLGSEEDRGINITWTHVEPTPQVCVEAKPIYAADIFELILERAKNIRALLEERKLGVLASFSWLFKLVAFWTYVLVILPWVLGFRLFSWGFNTIFSLYVWTITLPYRLFVYFVTTSKALIQRAMYILWHPVKQEQSFAVFTD